MNATAACREVRTSQKFTKFLEVIIRQCKVLFVRSLVCLLFLFVFVCDCLRILVCLFVRFCVYLFVIFLFVVRSHVCFLRDFF